MRFPRPLSLSFGVALWTALASPASAIVVFSDDFNRAASNVVGVGWNEIENGAGDVAIRHLSGSGTACTGVNVPAGCNNSLRIRDQSGGSVDAHAAQLTISTLGLKNLALTFDWAPIGASEASDTLFVEWRIGSGAWTTTAGTLLASFGLGGSAVFASSGPWALTGANNQANIQFRFRTDVNASDEGAWIDNVVLTGDPIRAIPEPASLALLAAGLFGTGIVLRRRRPRSPRKP